MTTDTAALVGATGAQQEHTAAAFDLRTRLTWSFIVIAAAVAIAGLWNYQFVDGIGHDLIAGRTVGETADLATGFGQLGAGFGFIFAMIAGLAATFTACNCVVFAMMPGLACAAPGESAKSTALKSLGVFTAAVLGVGAVYGMFVGFLGPDGIVAFNERAVRLAQANAVFTSIGLAMLAWGALEMGFLDGLKSRFSPLTRAFFNQPTAKAGIMGLMVGLFAVGRPFPVMRDFLTFAAEAQNPLYGALVLMAQGIGQIAVMVVLFIALLVVLRDRIEHVATTAPERLQMLGGLALLGGGAYFVFYWGAAFMWDVGRWGFKLGWYGG